MIKLNFPHKIVAIVQTLLSRRTFSVIVNNHSSDVMSMDAGVPQGSVLGPILFNIYVHDIPLHNKIKITQFADDTSIHAVHKDPVRYQSYFNSYLAKLSNYYADWKLKLNETKSELIQILGLIRDTNGTLRRNTKNMRIIINGRYLKNSGNIRVLGLQLQTNNRFTKHISLRLQKAKLAKFHLNRILRNSIIDRKIKNNMYKLYIRPVLMYASPVWCRQPQVSSHQMELLRQFERGCLRTTNNIRRPRGSFRHVNAKLIYEAASCMRIDRYAALSHNSFYSKCYKSRNSKFDDILRRVSRLDTPYQDVSNIFHQHQAGQLIINDRFTLFNTRYDKRPGLVYSLD